MAAKIGPYKFTPILKQVLWGGDKIAAFKGMQTCQRQVGESWEISSIKGDISVVAQGDEAGLTLEQLIDKHGARLVGKTVFEQYGNRFPLLVKFIDASSDLSIQVHPTDEMALRHGEPNGKTEMWYVINAEPDSTVINGLKQPISPAQFRKAAADGTITRHLAQHQTHAGDVFSLPAGQIHNIGAGNFIAEVQQASVTTYRIYDWGRTDANGKPRTLHTRLAAQAIDFNRVNNGHPIDYDRTAVNRPVTLVSNDKFHVSRLIVSEQFQMPVTDSFLIFMCLDGKATLTLDQDNPTTLQCGETVLIPACATTATLQGNATLLAVTPR